MLATKACRGSGPEFKLFDSRPLYRSGDAIAWAQATLTASLYKTDQREVGGGCWTGNLSRIRSTSGRWTTMGENDPQ
jgi:hypothetical protein